jgi:hypothetical protein
MLLHTFALPRAGDGCPSPIESRSVIITGAADPQYSKLESTQPPACSGTYLPIPIFSFASESIEFAKAGLVVDYVMDWFNRLGLVTMIGGRKCG